MSLLKHLGQGIEPEGEAMTDQDKRHKQRKVLKSNSLTQANPNETHDRDCAVIYGHYQQALLLNSHRLSP